MTAAGWLVAEDGAASRRSDGDGAAKQRWTRQARPDPRLHRVGRGWRVLRLKTVLQAASSALGPVAPGGRAIGIARCESLNSLKRKVKCHDEYKD